MKRICFFGIYDAGYARNRVLRLGFERNGWEVVECRVDPSQRSGIAKYAVLMARGMRARREEFDLVLVCFPGQSAMPLARLLFGRRVVFDAFLSLYDSNVNDRKAYGAWSMRGLRDWFLDMFSCRLARKILLDTDAHVEYFVRTFRVSRGAFIRAWIGADDTVFMPRKAPPETGFLVHFHGTFIPLQGVPSIIEAAALLKDEGIRFRLVGSGQEYGAARERIGALGVGHIVECVGRVPMEKVPDYMAEAHAVLGIFGDTDKAARVIPNKVYEAMAMGKAIVTADTPAMRELPGATRALLLVPSADARAIADAIRALKNDTALRRAHERAARAVFEKECLPERIVRDILTQLQ